MLKDYEVDVLTEIANISCGNAASSLADVLKKKIEIKVPKVTLVPIEKVPEKLGGADSLVTILYCSVLKELKSHILFILPQKEKEKMLASLVFNSEEEILRNVSQILFTSFLQALSKITDIKFSYEDIYIVSDLLGAIIDEILIELASQSKEAIYMENNFSIEKESFSAQILFIPSTSGLKEILKKLTEPNKS